MTTFINKSRSVFLHSPLSQQALLFCQTKKLCIHQTERIFLSFPSFPTCSDFWLKRRCIPGNQQWFQADHGENMRAAYASGIVRAWLCAGFHQGRMLLPFPVQCGKRRRIGQGAVLIHAGEPQSVRTPANATHCREAFPVRGRRPARDGKKPFRRQAKEQSSGWLQTSCQAAVAQPAPQRARPSRTPGAERLILA